MDFRGRGFEAPSSSGTSTAHHRVVLVSRGRNRDVGSGQGSAAVTASTMAASALYPDRVDATFSSHDYNDQNHDDDGSSSCSSTSVLLPSSYMKKKETKSNKPSPPSAKSAKPPSTVAAAKSYKSSKHATKSPKKLSPNIAMAPVATGEKDTSISHERRGNDAAASASAAVAVAAASKTSSPVNESSKQANHNIKSISTAGNLITSSASAPTSENCTIGAADGERKLFKKYEKSKVSKSTIISAKENEREESASATTAAKQAKRRKQETPMNSSGDKESPDREQKLEASCPDKCAALQMAAKSKKIKREGEKSEHAKESTDFHSEMLGFKPKAKRTRTKQKEPDDPEPSKESHFHTASRQSTESRKKKKSSKSNESKNKGPKEDTASVKKITHRGDVESPSSTRADYRDGKAILPTMSHFDASAIASSVMKGNSESKQLEQNGAVKDKEDTVETLRDANSNDEIGNIDIRYSSHNNSDKGENMGEDDEEDMDDYADESIDEIDNDKPKIELDDEENNPITQEISYHGVTFRSRRKKFQARLYRGCREHNLGLYDLAADAALAYDVGLRICDAGMPNEEDLDESMMVPRGDPEREDDHTDILGGLAAKFLSGGMLVGDEHQSEKKKEYEVNGDDSSIEDENAVIFALDWLNPKIKHDSPLARRLNAKANEFNFLVPLAFREARAEEIEDLRQGRGLHSYTQQDFDSGGDDEVEPIKPEDLPDEKGLMKKIQKEVLRLADGYLGENSDETEMMEDRVEAGSPMDSDSDEDDGQALDKNNDRDFDNPGKKKTSIRAQINQTNIDNDGDDAGESDDLSSRKRNHSQCDGLPLAKKRRESFPQKESNDVTEGIDATTIPENVDHVDREQQVHNLLSLTSQHRKHLTENKKKELAQKLSAIMQGDASPSQLNSMQNHPVTSSTMTDSLNAVPVAATACVNRNDSTNTAATSTGSDCYAPKNPFGAVGGDRAGSRNASESGIFFAKEPLTANMLKLVQHQQQRMRDQRKQRDQQQLQQQAQHRNQQQQQQQAVQQQRSHLQRQERHQPMQTNRGGHSGLVLSAADIANLFNLVDVGAITMDQLQQLLSSHRYGERNSTDANAARQKPSQMSQRDVPLESLPAHSAQVSTERINNQFGMKDSDRKLSTATTNIESPSSLPRPATNQGRNHLIGSSSNQTNASNCANIGSNISLAGFDGALPPDVIEKLKLAAMREGEEGHTNSANVQADTSDEVHALLQKQRANEAKKAALAEKLSALMGGRGNDRQLLQHSQMQQGDNSFGSREHITARASEHQSANNTQNGRGLASTNTPCSASHDSSRVAREKKQNSLKKVGNIKINERKAGGRRAGSVSAQGGHQHSTERANTSSARIPSLIHASNNGVDSGNQDVSRDGDNRVNLNCPDLPLSNSSVACEAASNALNPSNATNPGTSSLSSRLQTHVQSLQAAGLPENIDQETLRNLLMKKHGEERSTPVNQTLEMKIREIIGGEQQRPSSQQNVAQGNNDTASFISRQLRQLDEDQERNLLQSLLQESGSTSSDNDQIDHVQHALLQNILSNRQRPILQSNSQTETPTNSRNDGADATSFDTVNRRVAIETILSGDESRLTELREALQEQYMNLQNSSISLLNQLNFLGTNQSSISLESLMNRENAVAEELRNALILERLAQGNAGNNSILNGARVNEFDHNNQLMGLQALLFQNAPQGAFGGVSQDANVHQDMLLALMRGGGDGNFEILNNLNSGNNDGLNQLALVQARIQQGQGNNDDLGTLAQLLGLSRGNDADRVESGNNSFRRQIDGDS